MGARAGTCNAAARGHRSSTPSGSTFSSPVYANSNACIYMLFKGRWQQERLTGEAIINTLSQQSAAESTPFCLAPGSSLQRIACLQSVSQTPLHLALKSVTQQQELARTCANKPYRAACGTVGTSGTEMATESRSLMPASVRAMAGDAASTTHARAYSSRPDIHSHPNNENASAAAYVQMCSGSHHNCKAVAGSMLMPGRQRRSGPQRQVLLPKAAHHTPHSSNKAPQQRPETGSRSHLSRPPASSWAVQTRNAQAPTCNGEGDGCKAA